MGRTALATPPPEPSRRPAERRRARNRNRPALAGDGAESVDGQTSSELLASRTCTNETKSETTRGRDAGPGVGRGVSQSFPDRFLARCGLRRGRGHKLVGDQSRRVPLVQRYTFGVEMPSWSLASRLSQT
jgi:hypothetical protein